MSRHQQSTPRLYETNSPESEQRRALTAGEIPLAVYGLGKMGLPLALTLSDVTGNVTGVDIDPAVVEALTNRTSPVQGEPGLDELLQSVTEEGAFSATTDAAGAAEDAAIHVVIVPTVLDDENVPDLAALQAAIEDIGAGLSRGDVVIVESTVPPGTCRDVVDPLLADLSGLDTDEFGLAFCPERTSSGRALRDIRGSHPKVVGGKDAESTRVAALLYGEVTSNDVVTTTDCTTAECVKLFEGVYRDVNIALANELATLGEGFGIDVNETIRVANTLSCCDIHTPGVGVGGHCIPYYPHFVIDRADRPMPLVEQARVVNESMPAYTASLLEDALADHGKDLSESTVALLGITYRAGVDETRAAPAYPLASILSDLGTTVYAADPVCSDAGDLAADRVTIDVLPALDLDAVVVVTAHEEFRTLGWDEMDDLVVVDGRQQFRDGELPHPQYTLGDGRPTASDQGDNS